MVVSDENRPKVRDQLKGLLVRIVRIKIVNWVEIVIAHCRNHRSCREVVVN